MNKFLLIVFSTLIFHSFSHAQTPIIQSVINQTNLDSLMYFVEELSGEVQTVISGSPYTIVSRHYNNPSNDMAANYIEQKLESYGLPTYNQPFGTGGGRNVYAVQLGTTYPNKKYIICAHYDDMPSGPAAPGADDNASGTAAVLEAARIFSQFNSNYTIVYALWDEEERGLLGSEFYAQQAALAGDSIMGVINMDMIAWDNDNDSVVEIHIRPFANSIALKDQVVGINNTYSVGLTTIVQNPGTTASDQASFWYNGYGALLLIEEYYGGDFNAYYHTVNDKIMYFNQSYYHKMSRLAIGTVATLAEITDTVPVELLAFTASANNSEVQLLWSTSTELNNQGFEIECSITNSDNFVTIGFVEGKNSTTEISYYSFIDHPEVNSTTQLYYRLKQIDFDGTFTYSNVVNVTYNVPADFVLNQNYPNPFNPSTRINYFVPEESFVSIKVFDFLGREVITLVNDLKTTGNYDVVFEGSNLPSGTYFCTMTADNYLNTIKMVLIK